MATGADYTAAEYRQLAQKNLGSSLSPSLVLLLLFTLVRANLMEENDSHVEAKPQLRPTPLCPKL